MILSINLDIKWRNIMNIKKIVRLSFLIISILISCIFFMNKVILFQFKENNMIKEDISTLLSTQENMNKLIQAINDANSIKELEKLKNSFFTYEKIFEDTKKELFSKKSQDILDFFLIEINEQLKIKSYISILISNEHQIETYFDAIFKIQSEKIKNKKLFSKLYPKENNVRNKVEYQILKKNDLQLLKQLSDIKYHSKEQLFQHKDKTTFAKWIGNINVLIKQYPTESLKQYLSVANNIGMVVLNIEDLINKEKAFIKKINQTIEYNNIINTKIKNESERLASEFENTVYSINTILFLLLIIFILILAYKVNKNVSMSVDEIEQEIDNGLQEINDLNKEIADTQREVVFTMGAIGESRSKETGNHVKRVAEYSRLLALFYGLNETEAEILKQASPMHDIGKVAIPDSILNKPGRFNEEEKVIMNTHAQLGYEMLKHSNRDLLKAAAIVAHEHHEKWDGSGYPRGLSGEKIHIYGRITALADVFDALGSDRCYKKAWDDEKIFKLFMEEKGKHFDPTLITIFFDHLSEFLKIRDTFKDN